MLVTKVCQFIVGLVFTDIEVTKKLESMHAKADKFGLKSGPQSMSLRPLALSQRTFSQK